MLKPFAVRRLSGVIQIYPEEYDQTVDKDPSATLTYIDDDDGDKITVGSSFELSQRLDEPGSLVTRHDDRPLQIFDIRRRATGTWKEYRDRTRQRDLELESHGTETVHARKPPKVNDSVSALIENQSKPDQVFGAYDARKSWFEACQPPQLPQKQGEKCDIKCPRRITPTLTPEGQRQASVQNYNLRMLLKQTQAREAGAKFNWRFSKSQDRTFPINGATENRWARYSTSSENLEIEPSKETVKAEKSLLQSFEEDMDVVRKQDSNTAADKDRASLPSSRPTPTSRAENAKDSAKLQAPPPSLTGPGAVLFEIVSTLAGGLEMMGTELTKKLPEIERGIGNAQRDIPEAFHNTATELLNMLEQPIVSPTPAASSEVVSDASELIGRQNAAAMSAEGLLKGFGDLVKDIGDIGKAIFIVDETHKAESSAQQPVASQASSSSPNNYGDVSSKETDKCQLTQLKSVRSRTASAHPSTFRPQRSASNEGPHGCLPHCVIGLNRSHEHCVTKEPLTADDDNIDNDIRKEIHGSHFRLRTAQQTGDILKGSRSRSPSATRRSFPLQTKRSVNFVDRKGKIDRQEALNALKRHRSMASIHSRGRPGLTSYEASYEPIPEKSLQQNFLGRFDGRRISAYNGPQKQSLLSRAEPVSILTAKPAENLVKRSAILDQEDSDPDFSVRYPSLLSSAQNEHRGADVSRFESIKSFLSDFNPESEIARYPTVSQLQRRALNTQHKDTDVSGQKPPGVNAPFPPPLKIPGSWPQQEVDLPVSEESSGQFFDRMTGRTSGNHLARSNTVTASNPAARLPGPFDPLSDLAHTIREQKRRQAKQEDRVRASLSGISRTHSEKLSSSRRPYSETFTGAGRVPWESFVPSKRAHRPQATMPTEQGLREQNRTSTHTFFGQPPEVELNIDEKAQARRSAQIMPQKDKFDICVDAMREMGYGIQDPMEKDRLRLFAVAADGNVEAAVDMLEEKREASKTLAKRD